MRSHWSKTGKYLLAAAWIFGSTFAVLGQDCKNDAIFEVYSEHIDITKKEAAEYNPASSDSYVRDFNDNQNIYVKAALSASRRKSWLEKWKDPLLSCMNKALDELAVIAKKTLPTYHGPKGYTIQNPVETRLMRAAVSDIAEATVFRAATDRTTWKINTNSYGLPTSRQKYGIIWAKYPGVDDGFCRILYVNVVQDYSGGGTYGASYGKFVTVEFAGCPAGK